MGKKSNTPTPPPPPDPGAQLREEALYNRVGVTSPYGSISYSGDPYRNQATITLSPEQQALLDLQSSQGIQGGQLALDLMGNLDLSGIDYGALPGLDVGDQQQFTQDIYDQQVGLLNPQFAQQFDQLNTMLANRGIPVGSEIYGRGLEDFSRGVGSAYQQAALGSIQAGSQEQSRLYNQALQSRMQLGNEALQQYQLPFNTMANLAGYNQLTAPQFQGAPPLDVQGAYGQQNQYNMGIYQSQLAAQQAQQSGMMSGLFGLANQALPMIFSSKAYKTDREKITILDKLSGVPVERWRYKDHMGLGGELHIGPYAEDWHETFGTGDGSTIPILDMLGVLLGGMKELTDKVRRLENA